MWSCLHDTVHSAEIRGEVVPELVTGWSVYILPCVHRNHALKECSSKEWECQNVTDQSQNSSHTFTAFTDASNSNVHTHPSAHTSVLGSAQVCLDKAHPLLCYVFQDQIVTSTAIAGGLFLLEHLSHFPLPEGAHVRSHSQPHSS